MAASGVVTGTGNEGMAAAWDGPEGDHWADHADRYEATSTRYGDLLLDGAGIGEDSAVLDIGCGTGATTIAAGRIATRGSALGIDLSSRMLAVGRAAAEAAQLDHVRFEQADAQVHPFDAATVDVAVSSFGAMFFADPVAAFANIGRALRPGATLALTAWRELGRNEWVEAVRTALAAGRDLPTPPPGVPSPFSLADQTITTDRLRAAGYDDVTFTALAEPMFFGKDADDAYSFVSTLGITRGLTADLDDATKAAALELLHQALADHETADGVVFSSSAWLITATNRGEAG
jgi:SAM-dependent methyltransferase